MVAAYFACFENNEIDSAIYVYTLNEFYPPEENHPFDVKDFAIFFPSGLAIRIINQRGVCIVSGQPSVPLDEKLNSLEKYIITCNCKKDILSSLELFNINPLSLLQGLNSLSVYLNRYVESNSGRAPIEEIEKLFSINE